MQVLGGFVVLFGVTWVVGSLMCRLRHPLSAAASYPGSSPVLSSQIHTEVKEEVAHFLLLLGTANNLTSIRGCPSNTISSSLPKSRITSLFLGARNLKILPHCRVFDRLRLSERSLSMPGTTLVVRQLDVCRVITSRDDQRAPSPVKVVRI